MSAGFGASVPTDKRATGATAPVVRISEFAAATIRNCAGLAAPFETGGILIGVATPDGVWITTVIEVVVVDKRRTSYRAPARVTPMLVDEARKCDPRLGYIGDWHSHPADASASAVDLRTLRTITRGRADVKRVILVARTDGSTWRIEAWARADRNAVPIDLELTGGLPAAADDR